MNSLPAPAAAGSISVGSLASWGFADSVASIGPGSGVASPVPTIVGGALLRIPRSAAAASREKSPAER
jgi:hypothetical protein